MDPNEIKEKMLALQAELNSLANLLPENIQVDYCTREFRRTTDIGARRQLIIEFREIAAPTRTEFAVDLLYR
ncbi:MAG: hypothetical protein JWQ23_3579 [Herminiimonas sp.]|jgi:hypothetical protein|nr:hypothetical protein [Herminiimonas sp.]